MTYGIIDVDDYIRDNDGHGDSTPRIKSKITIHNDSNDDTGSNRCKYGEC